MRKKTASMGHRLVNCYNECERWRWCDTCTVLVMVEGVLWIPRVQADWTSSGFARHLHVWSFFKDCARLCDNCLSSLSYSIGTSIAQLERTDRETAEAFFRFEDSPLGCFMLLTSEVHGSRRHLWDWSTLWSIYSRLEQISAQFRAVMDIWVENCPTMSRALLIMVSIVDCKAVIKESVTVMAVRSI